MKAGLRRQLPPAGYERVQLELPMAVEAQVRARDWEALDRSIRQQTLPGGGIFRALEAYALFSSIEFIISIRSAPDEDGIWHDDGSRVLAFSLSLTLEPEKIEGGRLALRLRGNETKLAGEIPTPAFGTMIVFATGAQGYEHRIHEVRRGERLIIAGWCT